VVAEQLPPAEPFSGMFADANIGFPTPSMHAAAGQATTAVC
jgi:hypothetical protein